MPKSGKPEELLAFEEIDKNAIIKQVKEIKTNPIYICNQQIGVSIKADLAGRAETTGQIQKAK